MTGPRVELPVVPASRLIDAVGVNVHLAYMPSSYRGMKAADSDDRWSAIAELARTLGVHHIRDHVPEEPEVEAALVRLSRDHGLQVLTITPPPALRRVDDSLPALRRLAAAGALAGIEATNEPDNPPAAFVPERVRVRQHELRVAIDGERVLEGIPLLSPSLISEDGHQALGDLTDACDVANVHPYAVGPYREEVIRLHLGWSQHVAPGRPVWATETGYTTPTRPTDHFGAWCGVSNRAAAAYLPKSILTNIAAGVDRTYVYELVDEHLPGPIPPGHVWDPPFVEALADPGFHQGCYGLVSHDLAPKPAFGALQSLLRLLKPMALKASPPTALPVRMSDPTVRTLALGHGDGTVDLVLWHDVELYRLELQGEERIDPGDLYPVARNLEVELDDKRSVTTFVPTRGTHAVIEHGPLDRVGVTIPAEDVVVLRLRRAA